MTLIGHAHSSQFMERQNLGITTLKHAKCAPNVFKRLPENRIPTDFIYNFLKFCDNISHKLLRPSQFLEKLWKFWNGPLCRYKSGPFPLLNVAGYWKSSNTEACAQKLSQIPANNIDHGGRGLVSKKRQVSK